MPSSRRKTRSSWNPIAFVPAQVSFIASAIYIALVAALLWRHTQLPPAPLDSSPEAGINLTQAWLDVDFISDGYHSILSRRNAEVREYLLQRIENILKHNGVAYKVIEQLPGDRGDVVLADRSRSVVDDGTSTVARPDVIVFKDDRSNATLVDPYHNRPWTLYTESENILVYIRGSAEDEASDWWEDETGSYDGPGGVLVNAHYDSAPTGFGATDDGVGVATVLQLVSHFTAEGHRPPRGIVALLNNGEETAMLGAYNYVRNPLSQFPHTFLNLDGAGAGGRATLFRSTDAEVTRFYRSSPHPFGSVISGDSFKRGVIQSSTDYSVFAESLGLRGLDLAFFEPRSRYHTEDDDARDTGPDSLWNMLSAALATVQALSSYDGKEFSGTTNRIGKLDIGHGKPGVWFDLFGKVFAVCQLHTLFALSVTLLTAGPVLLIALEVIITKADRWYPLTRRQRIQTFDGDDAFVQFSGLRGLFRFPIAFAIPTVAVFALAYLLAKVNPYFIYSGEYAVWAIMLCAWFAVAWFLFAGADRVRPTALQRMYTLIWLYVLSWIALIAATVGENNFKIGSAYIIVVYNASAFAALLISYLELFGLPTKESYVEHVIASEHENDHQRPESRNSRSTFSPGASRTRGAAPNPDEEATERSSLLHGANAEGGPSTFRGIAKTRHADPDDDNEHDQEDDSQVKDPLLNKAYGDEQAWSSSLAQWTWIIQFLLLAPINIILIGQVALLITSALHMTPNDGNAVLPIYLIIAGLSVLLLLPLTPFLHRFKFQIPTLLFLVLIGCLIYSLLAFPFTRTARLKFYFLQRIDLSSGDNSVLLRAVDGYAQDIISALPSAMGQAVVCGSFYAGGAGSALPTCSWHGLQPNVVADDPDAAGKKHPYRSWLTYNVSHEGNTAQFALRGRDTKACRLYFDSPVTKIDIAGAAGADPRFPAIADEGSSQVRLYSRTWEPTFLVNVSWPEGTAAKGQTGQVACHWGDINTRGLIPAYDEVLRYAPVWSVPSSITDGLVEGFVDFKV